MKRATIALILSAGLIAPLAQANTVDTSGLRYAVKFADLDISQLDGAATLYRRLKFAANTVCRPYDRKELHFMRQHRECVGAAIEAAVSEVNKPILTAYHQQRAGVYGATSSQASTTRP